MDVAGDGSMDVAGVPVRESKGYSIHDHRSGNRLLDHHALSVNHGDA